MKAKLLYITVRDKTINVCFLLTIPISAVIIISIINSIIANVLIVIKNRVEELYIVINGQK